MVNKGEFGRRKGLLIFIHPVKMFCPLTAHAYLEILKYVIHLLLFSHFEEKKNSSVEDYPRSRSHAGS